jgi:hypothetical protein
MVEERPTEQEARPDQKRILASSAPWLAALLNGVPGLGTGYIYQRRWRPYWITTALATGWFILGALTAPESEGPDDGTHQLAGLIGLLVLAVVTMTESFLAGRKARMD